jgi:hypothetical protein
MKPTTRMRLRTDALRDPTAPKAALLTTLTSDPIFPVSVATEALPDLTSLELNALNSNVQDVPKFLTALSPEVIVLVALSPVISVLRPLAVLILRRLMLLDLTFPMAHPVLISPLLPRELSPEEHNLLHVLALKPLNVQRLSLSVLLALLAQP